MARHIHTIVGYIHTLRAQSRPLFIPRGGTQCQAQPATSAKHPVPGQASICRELPKGAPDPACRPPKPRQLGQLAIADDLAGRHLAEYRIQRRSSALGGFQGVLISVRHQAPIGLQMKPDRRSGK